MADKKNNLILAYFPNEAAATEAADNLKAWDTDLGAINLGAIGIMTMNKKGKLKTTKVGTRATGTGAKWGTIVGATAGILTGGIGLLGGAVVGLTVGAVAGRMFHKEIGMDDAEKERLEAHLKEGGAALAVMTNDHDVMPVHEKLGFLGGEVASYSIPDETAEELEAAAGEEDAEQTGDDEIAAEKQAVIHYQRPDGNYDGWGLHVWAGSADVINWHVPLQPTGTDDFGIYFSVPLAEDATGLGYIIHKGDEKDLLDDQFLDFDMHGYEVWVEQNTPGYIDPPTNAPTEITPDVPTEASAAVVSDVEEEE